MAVDFSRDGGVGLLTLDRPPANSYDSGFVVWRTRNGMSACATSS